MVIIQRKWKFSLVFLEWGDDGMGWVACVAWSAGVFANSEWLLDRGEV